MRCPPPKSILFRAVVALFCCGCAFWSVAAEKNSAYQAALESITTDELSEQVAHLADVPMEGREAGTRGGLAAANYLAECYQQLHLRGGADNDAFLQPFQPNYRNVLAILDGGDPELRDEVILVGAHYDHIGYGGHGLSLGPYGYVHPGADDNASGTSAVFEVAEAFSVLADHGERPKRSILFAAWDAEEKGMLGSKHWASHPTVPLDQVAAAVNLDMVGRLRENQLMIFGSRSGCGWRRLLSSQNDDAGLQLDFSWSLKPNADHYPFFEAGVPVLMFHTGMHDNYHRPSDAAKLINAEGMTRITRLLFGLLYELANRPERIAFRTAARHENPQSEKALLSGSVKPIDRLGVVWFNNAADAGGIRVARITRGSPADKAGLRIGDSITRFAGHDIQSDEAFFWAVAAAESPAPVTVKRRGEAEPVELSVELRGDPLRWGITWRIDDAEPNTVILTHVVPGSPAARAGLTAGDRVYQVGGRDFTDESAFSDLAKNLPMPLQLLIERDGRLRIVTIESPQVEPLKRAA